MFKEATFVRKDGWTKTMRIPAPLGERYNLVHPFADSGPLCKNCASQTNRFHCFSFKLCKDISGPETEYVYKEV